jgi:2'-5' RNA ligase
VLYINVVRTPELLRLQAALRDYLEAELGIVDPKAKQRPFAPHLTVASRNLTGATFRQAWAELQPRSFEFQFVAEQLTLLIYRGQRWQVQGEFPLLPNH